MTVDDRRWFVLHGLVFMTGLVKTYVIIFYFTFQGSGFRSPHSCTRSLGPQGSAFPPCQCFMHVSKNDTLNIPIWRGIMYNTHQPRYTWSFGADGNLALYATGGEQRCSRTCSKLRHCNDYINNQLAERFFSPYQSITQGPKSVRSRHSSVQLYCQLCKETSYNQWNNRSE